ncbi:hypothetical protein SAY87_028818 [Trapa incisa]|uniref:Autophagy-related protein 13 N-terminal domain-containing protein n=1 Tax=Trapa incisa TaxID=236973 RepID=A0AAN7KWZ9_9MYRT|nr:hypothetical protein SAY87_028818 [Trapa incisa]
MASSHSDAARMEQIITEFFAKSLHIILETRSPYASSRNFSGEQIVSSPSSSASSSSSVRPRDKWFNLALRECTETLENLDLWRQSNLEPMIVDVILVKRSLDWDPINLSPNPELAKNLSSKETHTNFWNTDQEELRNEGRSEKIVERWVLQYEVRKMKDGRKGGKRSSSNLLSLLYKKSMLLLRSLYVTVRLLPAYKIFRDLNLTGQICSFSLTHRVSSFAEPFTHREEAEMQRFNFSPIDTTCGRLCLSVSYRSSLSDVNSEGSTPMSPQFIPDYVGSPLADPLKRFPSVPMSRGSPSLPFSRRHSWSFDHYRASPPISYSPSPTYSEPYTPASVPCRFPPPGLQPHPHETSNSQKDNASFDEYYPSPTFSPSQSPSPPFYVPGSHISKALLRSESAPVNIPYRKLHTSSLLKNPNLPPSPPLKGSRRGNYRADKIVPPSHLSITADKLLAVGKDDCNRCTGVKISISRCSSRSFHDDFDDSEFSCPFDVDDDDIIDPGSRPESFDQKGHLREPLEPGGLIPIRKSQGAAVGALVDLLQKAPPLSQEHSQSAVPSQMDYGEAHKTGMEEPDSISKFHTVQGCSSSVASSGYHVSKTTADALEELRAYREMKNLLLSQAGSTQTLASYSTVERMEKDTK